MSLFLRVLIENCTLDGNNAGVNALNGVFVTIRNTVATGNKRGFRTGVPGGIASLAVMVIENSVATNNDTAVYGTAGTGGTTIFISNSTITSNEEGLVADVGATILTRQNNTIEANRVERSGNVSSFAAK